VIAELLVLIVLTPAIVVPVVLMFGFAGCSFEGHGVAPPADPWNLRVTETAVDSISLAWDYLDPHPEAVTFAIVHDETEPPLATGLTSKAFTHAGLAAGTAHAYQVRAVPIPGVSPSHTVPVPPLVATTRKFETVFTAAQIAPNPQNGVNSQNDTLIMRISAVSKTGRFVRITLRGIAGQTTALSAITISRAVPATAVQPWDSQDKPLPVTFDGGNSAVSFTGDGVGTKQSDTISDMMTPRDLITQGEDLLVALDVAAGSERIVRREGVPGVEAYVGDGRAEAASMPRTAGYNTTIGRVFCIELIELA